MEAATILPDARVDAAWMASHTNDPAVRFIEIDVSAAAYNAGHIPGAMLWNAYTDLRYSDYRPVSAAEFSASFAIAAKQGSPGRNVCVSARL